MASQMESEGEVQVTIPAAVYANLDMFAGKDRTVEQYLADIAKGGDISVTGFPSSPPAEPGSSRSAPGAELQDAHNGK
jgi:hypothetical protein